ncbi:hypothetical protein Tsubulata_021572, partial [Turnera subulata]
TNSMMKTGILRASLKNTFSPEDPYLHSVGVEHVENIGGSHYCRTLRCWRKNLLKNKSKILAMGFDEKFIRTWEYYFDYCAAGFKSYMLGDYQVVFSRRGNVGTLGDPYKTFPSLCNAY